MRLESILQDALATTAKLFPAVRRGYRFVHQAAAILKNEAQHNSQQVRRRLCGLLGAVARHRPRTGKLAAAMAHFLKVSGSYWDGLFCCYDVADLPRTNNDLEHLFGSNRYHERRATGRRNASPAMVLRGPVRLIAATNTRLSPAAASDLAPNDINRWRMLRAELEERRRSRVLRSRFRRDLTGYLRRLEDQLLKLTLPA
jgi:hypothetical protein